MCMGARRRGDDTVDTLGGDRVLLRGAGGAGTLGGEVVAVLGGVTIRSNVPVGASGAGGEALVAVRFRKISARALRACCWVSPNGASVVAGAGCNRAWVILWAARMAMLIEVVAGIGMSVGENSTVSEMRSAPVFEQIQSVTPVMFFDGAEVPSIHPMW